MPAKNIPSILATFQENQKNPEENDVTLKTILAHKTPGFVAVPPEMKISGVIGAKSLTGS